MGKLRTYSIKMKNKYYWFLDKIAKKKYSKKYPKFLNKIGVDIDYKNIGATWISPTVFLDSINDYRNIHIGKDVIISFDVVILCHDYSISTAARAISSKNTVKHSVYGEVFIGNNVFVGARTTILPNTYIGDNVIIGACSLVKGRLESGYIYAGVPAKKIGNLKDFAKKNEVLIQTSD